MIYLTLFYEFAKIGLFAIGGGLVTIPFLFDLSEKFNWFTPEQLTNMIAISESTPGAVGVNMATFAGFQAASVIGGIIATIGLVVPSIFIIVLISKFLQQYACDTRVQTVLSSIRPAVLALIIFATAQIMTLSIQNALDFALFAILAVAIRFYQKNPIFYILLSAAMGVILKL